jgi:spore germination protein GerM
VPRRTSLLFLGFMALLALIAIALAIAVPRWVRGSKARTAATVAPPAPPVTPGRRIKARLFYVDEDGARLTSIERDVAYGDSTVEQARQLIAAQIAPVAEPLLSAVPPSTRLLAIFVTERGDAFVDFSRELLAGHSGGSTDEMLTVYSIVNALTVNLPAVKSVQILVAGKQVETLAGHVDLRHPLDKNLAWVQ